MKRSSELQVMVLRDNHQEIYISKFEFFLIQSFGVKGKTCMPTSKYHSKS